MGEFRHCAEYLKRNNRVDDYLKVAERLVFLDPSDIDLTRELAIEWLGVQEADLSIDILATADEVLLTSSTRDLHPVVRMDERTWPAAGPLGREMQALFAARAATEIDP